MWLNAHTYYSYSYGTLSIERLLELARQSGNDRVVLTDINSTSAWVNFMRLAPQYGVEPYLGVDFRNGAQKCFVAIAANNEGLYEINQYLTQFLHRRESFPERAPQWQHTWVVYPWESYHHFPLRDFEWIGVSVAQVNKLFSQSASFRKRCVILQSTTFEHATGFNAHRLLRAIDNNQLLSKLPASELGLPDDRVFDLAELHKRFEAYPELVEQTHRLLNQCTVSIDFDSTKNKKSYTGSLSADVELLRNQCREGLLYRYGSDVPRQVIDRMESELQVITSMNFTPYFLINWDMVNYARRKGYYYIGRGSGANSLVAYLMRITDVDPIELNLYFERFINPYRSTPPDFDIDFSWTDRQDVTRYLFDTHSWNRVALLGAYITFQFKSVVREIGKVLGLPAHEIDALQQARHQPNDKLARAVLKYAQLIHGFPSHLSIHSSGIVIANEDIARYSATFLPPKGFPTTQFSMLEAEDIGLHKYDVLGQRGLAKIKDAVHLIKQNRGVEIDIHDIKRFTKDKRIEKMLSRGDAIGCFYVESPAMRMLLTKLKAHDYLRLVAASSIIRPGVAKSGMMREYILRFQDVNRRQQARDRLPELYDILEETFGVMVYQEDVLKVAHFFGGLTLAEADVLRRGMNWKYMQRTEFTSVKAKFLSNCYQKGYSEQVVSEIWNQIESFANFAFAKGHSASYAVESYQALFLKAYYPLEYMVATTNNGGGFYREELYLHEAVMCGAELKPPCVNKSDGCNAIRGTTIHIGLSKIAGIESDSVQSILTERHQRGFFKGLRDFVSRVPLSLEQLILLIRVGAFQFTGLSVKQLLWDAHFIAHKTKPTKGTLRMFEVPAKAYTLPELPDHPLEIAYHELELLGFPLISPFKLLKNQVTNPMLAGHLPFKINQQVDMVAYLVNRKPSKTANGQVMYFGTWLDQAGVWVDTVHFPHNARLYSFTGPGCYEIRGWVREEFGFICIEVQYMKRLETKNLDDLHLEEHLELSLYQGGQHLFNGVLS